MSSQAYLISDVRVFDGESIIHESGSVLISNGVISSISASPISDDSLPEGTVTISGSGQTLLPGLIDAHIHALDEERALEQSIKFGVTTVLDMSVPHGTVAKLQKIVAERHDVSDFRSCVHAATVPGGWPDIAINLHQAVPKTQNFMKGILSGWPRIPHHSHADEFVDNNIRHGASYIKLMHEGGQGLIMNHLPTATFEVQSAIVNAAHKRELIVVAHATSQEDTLFVLKAGVDGLTHTFVDSPPNDELVELYKSTGAFVVPTLVVLGSVTGELKEETAAWGRNHHVHDFLNEDDKNSMSSCLMWGAPQSSIKYAYESVRKLKAAGIDILCGTDTASTVAGTTFGLSLHEELSLLVKGAGLTPVEALRSATSVTARRFKLQDRGRIAPGLKADILLVRGNPTTDITQTVDIAGVWRDGFKLQRVVASS